MGPDGHVILSARLFLFSRFCFEKLARPSVLTRPLLSPPDSKCRYGGSDRNDGSSFLRSYRFEQAIKCVVVGGEWGTRDRVVGNKAALFSLRHKQTEKKPPPFLNRWSGRQDVHAHDVHERRFPRRVCSYSV